MMLLDATLREILAAMQNRIMTETTYRGVPTLKCPLDMWRYAEIIYSVRPSVLIEIGNFSGGTLLYLSDICRAAGIETRGIGVDIDHKSIFDVVRQSGMITLVNGDAVASFEEVCGHVMPSDVVMIIEDSSHEYENTLAVLNSYSSLITVGSYFIIEDTICRHGLDVGPSPGPMEAVQEFLRVHKNFESDDTRSFGITWNETGFIKRKS